MPFFIYIIHSLKDKSYYKGFTENPVQRIDQHNNGESKYTSNKVPWMLVYVEEMQSKKDALIREKKIKKYSHSQIEGLINSSKNIVDDFR